MTPTFIGHFDEFRSTHPAIMTSVHKVLVEQRSELVMQLAAGSVRDWADYQHRVGMIRGIDQAIEACIDAEKENERRLT